MVFHVAEYLSAMIALFADKDLVVAAGVRVNKGALIVQGFQRWFHGRLLVNRAVKGVKIC